MNPRLAWRSSERGFFTLIGLLVVLVIIAILFVTYFGGPDPGGPAGSGSPATTLGGAKDRASDTVCRNNIQQLRQAVSIHAGTSGANPPSLAGLQAGISLTCPAGDESYDYDPRTGKVNCPHPGHEGY